jgi:hypothetical protein
VRVGDGQVGSPFAEKGKFGSRNWSSPSLKSQVPVCDTTEEKMRSHEAEFLSSSSMNEYHHLIHGRIEGEDLVKEDSRTHSYIFYIQIVEVAHVWLQIEIEIDGEIYFVSARTL